jgi:hypothetical protein
MLCAKFFTRKSGSAQNLSFSGHEMNLGPHFVVLLGWLLLELDVGHQRWLRRQSRLLSFRIIRGT